MKPLIAVLSLVCIVLGVQLYLRQAAPGQGGKELAAAGIRLNTLSNEVAETRIKAEEEARLSAYLQSNLTARVADLAAASNALGLTTASLSSAQSELKTVQEEAKKQAARVAELEGQKDEMQVKLNELAGSIQSLNSQIAEAKRKLAAAEGDKDSISKELAKLQTDKAELLRQFNDLAALRAQVALLKEEAAVNQRLAWMAQGVYQSSSRKGAEALIAKPTTQVLVGNPSLNVEVRENGSTAAPAMIPAAN